MRPDGKRWQPAGLATAYRNNTIPILPDWIAAMIRPAHKADAQTKQSNEQRPDRPPWSEAEDARVRDALKLVPSDARETWLRVGAALHWTGWPRRGRSGMHGRKIHPRHSTRTIKKKHGIASIGHTTEGGWVEHAGCTVFNLYRAPTITPGDPHRIQPWIEHLDRIYPDDADHIIRWLAHRVQRPGDKVNHALVLGGAQGIGKDTLLEPVRYAVGPWNFCEVSPQHLLGRFNGYVKSVILRVSEARDLGDVNRYAFYDHMKIYTAAPPDVLRCDEKNLREYSVPNVSGVVITSNHKTDGIYLPADDRRHFVAWCDLTKSDFETDYWNNLYGWYEREGYRNVAAYLAQVDLSKFDPKAPPPHTAAFHAIVDANRAPEDAEIADILDELANIRGGPVDAITLQDLIAHTPDTAFAEWLRDRKNRKMIPHRLEDAGYVPVRNDAADDGLWRINNKRMVVYARRELSVRQQLEAVERLTARQ